MTEGRAAAGRRRARRPTEAAARLERLRKRNAEQLQAQRDAARRVETALQTYVDADTSLSDVEQDRDGKIASLQQQIDQVCAAAQSDIEQIRLRQAIAVCQISDAGRTVQEISELLEISQKDARRLLSAGRAAADQPSSEPTDDSTMPTDQHAQPAPSELPSGEQRILSGVDAHQHGPDPRLIPAVPHGSSQCT